MHPLNQRVSKKDINITRSISQVHFLSIVIAQSGQTIAHMPQPVHVSRSLGCTAGVPYTPSSSDQSMTFTGHFCMQSPQPLHRPVNIVNKAFLVSNCLNLNIGEDIY